MLEGITLWTLLLWTCFRCVQANLVVHPDKVSQKGGSVEQIVIADMAFDALKTAYNKFEASELRR